VKTTQIFIIIAFFALWQNAKGQGFVNLDFENATIAPTPVDGATYPADPTQCFPGWTVGGATTVVAYNTVSLGAPAISLIGPDFPNNAGFTPLQGSYSVLLQYFNGDGGPPTLSQTGLIPSGTQSINFLVGNEQSDAVVTLNGVNIPLTQISGGRLAGDISTYADSISQLTFSTTTGNPQGDVLYFDDIQFSSSPIPEPSTFGLFALGSLVFGWPFFRKRQ
jgi:hypothetical protein